MSYCYQADQLREAAGVLENYVNLENDLIRLAGFNLITLIDKLKAGYTLQLQEPSPVKYMPDGTPHLIDATTSYDAIYRHGKPVYALNIGVTWDDLDEEEQRILSESLEYYKQQEKKRKRSKL